jgi:hypothetical protein
VAWFRLGKADWDNAIFIAAEIVLFQAPGKALHA